MRELPETDVAVIGAGFSGLAAARRLHAAGRSVTVLESRDGSADASGIPNWKTEERYCWGDNG